MTFSFVERRACPACGSADRITLVDTPLDGPVIGPVVGAYYAIDPGQLAGDAMSSSNAPPARRSTRRRWATTSC
jgi:hypothetical protein